MSDPLLPRLDAICGAPNVLAGADAAAYGQEPTGHCHWTPRAVVRRGSTDEVAAILRLAQETRTPVVPLGGGTGLTGATAA